MKLFVWDFHGTLEKGNEYAAIEFSNVALERLGYKQKFTNEHVDLLYGKKWYQYFEYLLPDEPHEVHLALQEISFGLNDSLWHIVEKYIKPNDHSLYILYQIARRHDQILISQTNPDALSLFVQVVNMDRFFPQPKSFGVDGPNMSKKDVLYQLLKVGEYDEVIIIGDSPTEMEMYEVAGGVRYLYAHPGKQHREADAEFKISDLSEVLNQL